MTSNRCMSRIKLFPYSQCRNNRKYDEYCGIHNKLIHSLIRIDEPINQISINKTPKINNAKCNWNGSPNIYFKYKT